MSVSLDPWWGTPSACAGQRWANASAPAHLATSGTATTSCGLSPAWPPAGAFSSPSVLSRPRAGHLFRSVPGARGSRTRPALGKLFQKADVLQPSLQQTTGHGFFEPPPPPPEPHTLHPRRSSDTSPPPAPARRPEPCSAESHPQTHLLSLQRPDAMGRKP